MDKVLKKQFEQFGIETTRVTEAPAHVRKKQEFNDNNISVVKALMDSMQGRQWLYSKLDMCGTFATPFVAGKPELTWFLCGLQEVGHHLQAEIMQAAPEQYYLMTQEVAALNSSKKEEDQ